MDTEFEITSFLLTSAVLSSSSSNTGARATMARYYFTETGYNQKTDDVVRRAVSSVLSGWPLGYFQSIAMPTHIKKTVSSVLSGWPLGHFQSIAMLKD